MSTSGQNLDRQTRALTEAGCIRVFADKQSGKTADRPELAACLDYLREGDALVVTKPDRLARSTAALLAIEADLSKRGIGLVVLSMGGEKNAPVRRVRVAEIFNRPIRAQQDLEEALNQLREVIEKLIDEGAAIILE